MAKRTARTGETLPSDVVVANSTRIRLTLVKLICTACAFEYCPNAYSYALPNGTPSGATLDTKQPCGVCHARSPIGVTDPANYGGVHPYFEK